MLEIDFSNSHMKILALKTAHPAHALLSFNVSHNDISSKLTKNSLFISADHLQWIDLSYNKISDISSDVFNRFASLQKIDLSCNLINNLDGYTFSNLQALEILKLNNNLLQSIRLRFNKDTSLTTLDVSYNAIESIAAEEFSNMPNLMNLQLSNNKLRIIDAQIFAGQSNLRTLDLSHNNFKDFDVKLLNRPINLAALYVDDIGLTSIDRLNISLEYFPSLKRIGISHNHWPCSDLSILLKHLISLGITVQVKQPAKNQHVNSVECIAEDYMEIMSKFDKSIDEVRKKFNGTVINLEQRMNNISNTNDEERNKISRLTNELEEKMKKIHENRTEIDERMINISESRKEYEERMKKIVESHEKLEASRKKLDDHLKESNKLLQHTVYYVAVSFLFIGILIVLFVLSLILLRRLNRKESDLNLVMSKLLHI